MSDPFSTLLPPPQELLRRVSLFADLEAGELDRLAAEVQLRSVRSRQVVIREGDVPDALFTVMRGYLKVTSRGPNGRDALFGVLGPTDVFGELAILDGAPRSATVTTLAATELLVIPCAAFMQLVSRQSTFAVRVLGVLTRRVRSLSTRREQLGSREVAERLAAVLADLAQRFGRPEDGGTLIEVRLSQQELGDLVGATRESVNKHLREWSRRGFLRQQAGRVWLQSAGELPHVARAVVAALG